MDIPLFFYGTYVNVRKRSKKFFREFEQNELDTSCFDEMIEVNSTDPETVIYLNMPQSSERKHTNFYLDLFMKELYDSIPIRIQTEFMTKSESGMDKYDRLIQFLLRFDWGVLLLISLNDGYHSIGFFHMNINYPILLHLCQNWGNFSSIGNRYCDEVRKKSDSLWYPSSMLRSIFYKQGIQYPEILRELFNQSNTTPLFDVCNEMRLKASYNSDIRKVVEIISNEES